MTHRPSESSGMACALGALALLAAGCHSESPRAAPVAAVADASPQEAKLQPIADAFRKFHEDTGGWPMGNTVWNVNVNQQVDGIRFGEQDTALFSLPHNIKQCTAEGARPCWNGPYLPGKSMADAAYLDQWKHPAFFMLLRPRDGFGGGSKLAPNGLVAIWSAGADGKDGFGCSDATCIRDINKMATATPSKVQADDVVLALGPVM